MKKKLFLGIVCLTLSRTTFFFIDDPEGPNLLVVTVLAVFIYVLFLVIYFLYKKINLKLK
jgi:hypothetical protein